jgi:high-affinity nickel-transport protein
MIDHSHDWLALLALAFAMGLKHGLDADHLAAIDGLARLNSDRARPRLARWCGFAFSAGHGSVVLIASVLVGRLSGPWHVPIWVEDLGALISVGALAALGVVNLRAVFATPRHEPVRPVGLRAGWFGRLQRSGHPAAPVVLGAMFALSFDTLSLASVFALTATRFGGLAPALSLGAAFSVGMVLVDSMNGLWIARLLRRADASALFASRVMGAAVAGVALSVATFGVAKYLSPRVAGWSEGRELGLGVAVLVLLALAFGLAQRGPRSDAAVESAERS